MHRLMVRLFYECICRAQMRANGTELIQKRVEIDKSLTSQTCRDHSQRCSIKGEAVCARGARGCCFLTWIVQSRPRPRVKQTQQMRSIVLSHRTGPEDSKLISSLTFSCCKQHISLDTWLVLVILLLKLSFTLVSQCYFSNPTKILY